MMKTGGMKMTIYEKLLNIQTELEVPKSQFNAFGKYNYRSCEDILAAVKPLCKKYNCTLKLFDEVVEVGGRHYVKATARLIDCEELTTEESPAYAREEETKKGMDGAQITGSASSYARKYALNGLFCLDDVKDPDSTNKHGKNGLDETTDEEIKEYLDDKQPEEITGENLCEVCGVTMLPAQVKSSKHNFNDRVLCLDCRKEVK